VNIRLFRFPEDYPAVLLLWQNAGPGLHVRRSDAPQEIAKKLQRDPDLFLLAEEDGQVVGTVLGGFDGRRGMVYHLAVAVEYRRRGVGSALMQALEQRLRAKGCIRSYLLVTTDNTEAHSFYDNLGWQRMDDIYIYGKNL
jgi:ribosomal protein S18 acetylase RimI-like enzyme